VLIVKRWSLTFPDKHQDKQAANNTIFLPANKDSKFFPHIKASSSKNSGLSEN